MRKGESINQSGVKNTYGAKRNYLWFNAVTMYGNKCTGKKS